MPVVARNISENLSPSATKDRRLFYSGERREERPRNEPLTRGSKAVIQSSTFNTLLFLFFAAVAIVLYISNIIAVNRLAVEVNDLQQAYDAIRNENEILRAEINRRSSLERIGRLATEQLGLQHPKEPAKWIEVDHKQLERLQKIGKRH